MKILLLNITTIIFRVNEKYKATNVKAGNEPGAVFRRITASKHNRCGFYFTALPPKTQKVKFSALKIKNVL